MVRTPSRERKSQSFPSDTFVIIIRSAKIVLIFFRPGNRNRFSLLFNFFPLRLRKKKWRQSIRTFTFSLLFVVFTPLDLHEPTAESYANPRNNHWPVRQKKWNSSPPSSERDPSFVFYFPHWPFLVWRNVCANNNPLVAKSLPGRKCHQHRQVCCEWPIMSVDFSFLVRELLRKQRVKFPRIGHIFHRRCLFCE